MRKRRTLRFKLPPPDLVWYPILPLLASAYLTFSYASKGDVLLLSVYGSYAALLLLIYFDQKWVTYPLTFYFVAGLTIVLVMNPQKIMTVKGAVYLLIYIVLTIQLWLWTIRGNRLVP